MKKPLVIFLLICFLLQAGGLWMVMYLQQIALKSEMRSRLRSDPNSFEQVVLEFELVNGKPVSPSFEWEEENEFRYNGSMYDVIEKKVTGNILQVRCIDDEMEAAIMKKMEDLQKKDQDNNKSGTISLQQVLSLLLFHQHNSSEKSTLVSPLLHIDYYCAFISPVIIDITSPPPRRLS